MKDSATLSHNFDSFDSIIKFKKDFRKEIIEDGLDSILTSTATKLKSELKTSVNSIMMNPPSPTLSPSAVQFNDLEQTPANIPKSEAELLKFLTDGKTDPSKYNKAKDFTTLSETNIVFANRSVNQANANRVTLRMDIEPGETVEAQYGKVKAFFKDAVIALPGRAGTIDYFMNPGIDITKYVKIKCSTQTGDGNGKPYKGLNPTERFEKASNRNYVDWTLKQEAVDIIRKSFVNITQVMDEIKSGDLDKAADLVKAVDKNETLTKMAEQIEKLKTDTKVPTSTKAYMNSINLINSLKISKKISKEDTVYSLVGNTPTSEDKNENYLEHILSAIRTWAVEYEETWFKALTKKANELIKQYSSTE